MRSSKIPYLALIQLLVALMPSVSSAQEQKKGQEPARPETTEVLRINTELVQTDVTVFDKKGRFVEGLQAEQFELQVDGKPQPISFFEAVRTGSQREEAQLKAARGGKNSTPVEKAGLPATSSTGRTVLFYIDDFHLSAGNISSVHKALLDFIDNKLAENDQVAITSASGRIGFLQQLTDNKTVLHAAVERITFVAAMGRDYENPPMSEYAALLLVERRDEQLFNYFVEQTIKTGIPREFAGAIVERRATAIVRNSATTNKLTLTTLGNLLKSIVVVPGRKLVFFMSEGFVPNYAGSDITDALHRTTEAAAAAGVVIYSIDPRGLATTSSIDASSGGGFDSYGVVGSRLSSELSASQEPLHAVASATGGRALLNTNALGDSISKGLDETSSYYLLAWRPDNSDDRALKSSKIKVTIAERPDLEVKLRSGYLGAPSRKTKTEVEASALAGTTGETLPMISPGGEELPTSVFVGYKRSSSNALQLVAFISVDDPALYNSSAESHNGEAQVVGVVFDSKGKPVGSFRRGVVIAKDGHGISNYQVNLPPGLYQVRVFAKEKKGGRLGFAHQWIEIPEVRTGRLAVSSLYPGELEKPERDAGNAQKVNTSASRRFAQASSLRFTAYIYEALHGAYPPDLSIQTRIIKGGKPVVTTPERKISTDSQSGFAAIPYSAEFSLNKLPLGRYVLEVVVNDRGAKSTATQQTEFIVY